MSDIQLSEVLCSTNYSWDHHDQTDDCPCSACVAHAERLTWWLAVREQRVRDEEREGWASWLESWSSAVGAEPPTVEAVIKWLRAPRRPWGVYAARAEGKAGEGERLE